MLTMHVMEQVDRSQRANGIALDGPRWAHAAEGVETLVKDIALAQERVG